MNKLKVSHSQPKIDAEEEESEEINDLFKQLNEQRKNHKQESPIPFDESELTPFDPKE